MRKGVSVPDLILLLAATCAVVLTGLNVASQLRANSTEPDRIADNWSSMLSGGQLEGDESAPFKIAVFSDYECSSCRSTYVTLRTFMGQYPDLFAVKWYHLPLPDHPVAAEAARAAACSEESGRFPEVHSKLFEFADSLGTWSLASFADRAGLADTSAFNECIGSGRGDSLLSVATRHAKENRVFATPTILMDSALYIGMSRGLRRLIRDRIRELDRM